MFRRITLGIIIISALGLAGCGTSTGKTQQSANPQTKTQAQTQADNTQKSTGNAQEAQVTHLTPIPQGTPLVKANNEVTKQLMAQKDVIGTQIFEQQGVMYGGITFKGGVDKSYAHDLANEFLSQLKINYPKRSITTQVVINGKITDSITYKP